MESKNKGPRKLIELSQIDAYKKASDNLIEMYKTEVGRKFVHHLIYAFTAEKNTYILFSRNPLFDCLTKSKLQSVFSEDRPVNDEFINSKLIEYKSTTDDESKKQISEAVNNRVFELINSNPIPRLAIRSELTDKVMGSEELQALTDFIKDQIAEGNKVITGMIRYVKHKDEPKESKPYYTRRAKKEVDSRKTLGSDEDLRSKLESVFNR